MAETGSGARKGWEWYLALFVGGLLLAWVLSLIPDRCEQSIRTAGGALELFGLVSVALGMSRLRQDFGMEGTASEILGDLSRWIRSCLNWFQLHILRRRPPPITVYGSASVSGSSSTRGRGKVGPGPDWTVEQRLHQLERIVDSVTDSVWRLEEDLRKQIGDLTGAVREERAARKAASLELEKRVRDVAVGGLRLETIGLVWLFGGLTLTTWSGELANLNLAGWLFAC